MIDTVIVYVDMDHVLCDYDKGYRKWKKKYSELKFPQSQPGMYLGLDPIPGAIDAYRWLEGHPKAQVHILTAPSVKNPHCYTEKRLWVGNHLGMKAAESMIISPAKNLNKGDFLIDDCPEGKGQDEFEGELLLFGSDRFPDWSSVIDFLEGAISI